MEPFSHSPPLFETRIRGLREVHQGKVRDIYDVDADHLLIVTSDRLSAFDVVLPDPIPFKGEVLTRISALHRPLRVSAFLTFVVHPFLSWRR